MSSLSWAVVVLAIGFALLPGLLIGTRWERVLLLAVPLVSLGWILLSNLIFGTRDQLYGGGMLVFMAVLPPMLLIWGLASLGAGLAVTRFMHALGGRRAAVLGWVAGATLAVALPFMLVLAGLGSSSA